MFCSYASDKKNILEYSLKSLFRKRSKVVSKNSFKGRKTPTMQKVYSKNRKITKTKNNYSFSSSIYSSILILTGFIGLSLSIFFLAKQLQPLIKNERLKFLCTYQLGNKKSQSYKDSKLELEKLIGDSDKYCENFLIPKGKNKFGFFRFMGDIFFRFI